MVSESGENIFNQKPTPDKELDDPVCELESKENVNDKVNMSNGIKDPLICESENPKAPEQKDLNSIMKHCNGDYDNAKPGKGAGVSFSSGDLCKRDLLSSPTSSRTFGFGSLGIIMDNDDKTEHDCPEPER